jgi:hypothetical protein
MLEEVNDQAVGNEWFSTIIPPAGADIIFLLLTQK